MATNKQPVFEGMNIREVWDFRLSLGSPILFDDGKNWTVKIFAKDPGDRDSKVLEEFTTNVITTNNPADRAGIIACYEWLYSVRDKYSLGNLELRKPVVKMINDANMKAVKLNRLINEAETVADRGNAHAELQAHLKSANKAIKKASVELIKQIKPEGEE